MPVTYEPIATTTISGANTSSIVFNSIPQTYTDLRLVVFTRRTITGADNVVIRFNNVSTGTYSGTYFNNANGSADTDFSKIIILHDAPSSSFNAGAFGACVADIFDYTSTNMRKTVFSRSGSNSGSDGSGINSLMASTNQSTSAITRIDILWDSTSAFPPGTIATLFGIKAA